MMLKNRQTFEYFVMTVGGGTIWFEILSDIIFISVQCRFTDLRVFSVLFYVLFFFKKKSVRINHDVSFSGCLPHVRLTHETSRDVAWWDLSLGVDVVEKRNISTPTSNLTFTAQNGGSLIYRPFTCTSDRTAEVVGRS